MPKFTKEQLEAINYEGENILVSAGAGSGKTAVLTERIVRKIQEGCNINELLVLTFTKAAAVEMKERVRKKLKDLQLEEQLKLIDSSYITTFDSFSLAILKKYHYIINLDKNVKVTDYSIIQLAQKEILDTLFDELYLQNDSDFIALLDKYTIKDDTKIRKMCLEIYHKLELKTDLEDFLNTYEDNYLTLSFVEKKLQEYEKMIIKMLDETSELYDNVTYLIEEEAKFDSALREVLMPFLQSKSLMDLYINRPSKFPRLTTENDNLKIAYANLKDNVKEIVELLWFQNPKDYINSVENTFSEQKTLIKILLMFHNRLMQYKLSNNAYGFNDIAKMSLNIIKRNENVRLELKNTFKEILIDEYQDTSDIQEEFVKLFSNNNLYMVGDIKQSIYRFRNANPKLFKEKYINYGNHIGGKKIDLMKNFRSRREVLDDINVIFRAIMSLEYGGACYPQGHEMVFGNMTFEEIGAIDFNTNYDVLSYDVYKNDPLTKEYKKEEIECFMICKDIISKINNKYQVFDHEKNIVRDATYKDFTVLVDRKSNFSLYKKIFDYFNLPIAVYEDEELTKSTLVKVINNILKLVLKCHAKEYDTEMFYALMSVSRSFLMQYNDDFLKNIKTNFINNEAFIKAQKISSLIGNASNLDIFRMCIEEFDLYNKSILIKDVEDTMVKIAYLTDLLKELSQKGYSLKSFVNYIDDIYESELKITYKANINLDNAVSLMTIHRSKGLEYRIVYVCGLEPAFNISDTKSFISFTDDLGLVFLDVAENAVQDSFYKVLLKNAYLQEEISEKIRLFYVALTRAKEKIILVDSRKYDDDGNIIEKEKNIAKAKCFRDFIYLIPNINQKRKNIPLPQLGLTKDYDLIRDFNYHDFIKPSNKIINHGDYEHEYTVIEKKRPSKKTKELVVNKNLELGNKLHEILEYLNFYNPNLEHLEHFYRSKIENFLNCELLKNVKSAQIFKEHEFIMQIDDTNYHGIIDLMLVYNDHIDIIDYKLKNILDENYIKQLELYSKYARQFTSSVTCYLYSILDGTVKKVL